MTGVASHRHQYIWVQLTRAQLDAVLAVAAGIDRRLGELHRYLPAPGDRHAFHAAMTTLTKLQTAARDGS